MTGSALLCMFSHRLSRTSRKGVSHPQSGLKSRNFGKDGREGFCRPHLKSRPSTQSKPAPRAAFKENSGEHSTGAGRAREPEEFTRRLNLRPFIPRTLPNRRVGIPHPCEPKPTLLEYNTALVYVRVRGKDVAGRRGWLGQASVTPSLQS